MSNKKVLSQISLMMYGFGDSHEPDPNTVELVESIVRDQLRSIVNEALKHQHGKVLKGETLVFLLRHNKYKMQRFVRHLKTKEIASKCSSVNAPTAIIDPEEEPKRKLLEFIEYLDETGEFLDTSEMDETKIDRMIRADCISRNISKEKYMEYQRARSASFKKMQAGNFSFKSWVDPQNEIEFDKDALDVLSYFAFQTVADIVDYAFFVREDAKSEDERFEALDSSYTMFNLPHGSESQGTDASKVHINQLPISVNEVHEVMRRVHSPQAGKLNFGGPVPDTHYLFAL